MADGPARARQLHVNICGVSAKNFHGRAPALPRRTGGRTATLLTAYVCILATVGLASPAWFIRCRPDSGRLLLHCRRGIRIVSVDRHARSGAVSTIRRRGLHDSEPAVPLRVAIRAKVAPNERASVGEWTARSGRESRGRGEERPLSYRSYSKLVSNGQSAFQPPRANQRLPLGRLARSNLPGCPPPLPWAVAHARAGRHPSPPLPTTAAPVEVAVPPPAHHWGGRQSGRVRRSNAARA